MPRIKNNFTLYPRRLKNGQTTWYYQTYTTGGKRTIGRSTGETSKTKARNYCEELFKSGKLIPKKSPTLSEWAESRQWWVCGDDGPECLYCRSRLARSAPDRPAIQRRYVDDARRILYKVLLPRFGAKRLDQITPEDCEELLFAWSDQGLAPKTVNNRASILRTMTGEAYRLELITRDPWERIALFTAASKPRGSLAVKGNCSVPSCIFRSFYFLWSFSQLFDKCPFLVVYAKGASGMGGAS